MSKRLKTKNRNIILLTVIGIIPSALLIYIYTTPILKWLEGNLGLSLTVEELSNAYGLTTLVALALVLKSSSND